MILIIGANSLIGEALGKYFTASKEPFTLITNSDFSNITHFSPSTVEAIICLKNFDCKTDFFEFDLKLWDYAATHAIKYIAVFDKTYFLAKFLAANCTTSKNIEAYANALKKFQDWICIRSQKPFFWYGIQTNVVYDLASIFQWFEQEKIQIHRQNQQVSIDWIHVEDVLKLIVWFIRNNKPSGFYTLTGSFRRTLEETLEVLQTKKRRFNKPEIQWVEYGYSYPDFVQNEYDMKFLRASGYHKKLKSFEEGIR